MGRFYGSIASEKKTIVTKMGNSRLESHTRTWDHGVCVKYYFNEEGETICDIWKTGGSNNPDMVTRIKRFTVKSENKRPGREYYGRAIGNGHE